MQNPGPEDIELSKLIESAAFAVNTVRVEMERRLGKGVPTVRFDADRAAHDQIVAAAKAIEMASYAALVAAVMKETG